jgi:hypothetical protein
MFFAGQERFSANLCVSLAFSAVKSNPSQAENWQAWIFPKELSS